MFLMLMIILSCYFYNKAGKIPLFRGMGPVKIRTAPEHLPGNTA